MLLDTEAAARIEELAKQSLHNNMGRIGLPFTFDEYTEDFKKMLVRRYQWTVTDAFHFNNPELKTCYDNELSVQYAYYQIFNVEQDLIMSHTPT